MSSLSDAILSSLDTGTPLMGYRSTVTSVSPLRIQKRGGPGDIPASYIGTLPSPGDKVLVLVLGDACRVVLGSIHP